MRDKASRRHGRVRDEGVRVRLVRANRWCIVISLRVDDVSRKAQIDGVSRCERREVRIVLSSHM